MKRPLTKFEREHGYTPCAFVLGQPGCDVDLTQHPPGASCGGTWGECCAYKNASRFGGVLVPGHPVGQLLIDTIPDIKVTFDDDVEPEAKP